MKKKFLENSNFSIEQIYFTHDFRWIQAKSSKTTDSN